MAVTQLICPECSATLRLKEEIPDGKRVRCRNCKTVFTPNQRKRDDDDDLVPEAVRRRASARYDDSPLDRPRTGKKKRKKKQTNPAMIVIAIAVSVLVLLGGAAAIYFLTNSDDKKPQAAAPPIQAAPGTPPIGKGNSGVNPNAGPAGNAGINVGNLAMEIEAEDIDGKRFKLSDYRGKVVVLDFWGHW